ncbi:uncharacterized protein Dana_GF27612, isoform E [Drosophila ananassae]|uniref:Uncharacterized protein, isoform E n=1 Tax=Drosophila ananassae TaxID=7217 RepID=A0A0P9AJJ2_DROAN|nr:uncharacterized protein LOC26515021 [Drosophila ananassae]KPU77991.1 uncharacterized protein Dana_GF27612, isoform E [Drosophila ananassae]
MCFFHRSTRFEAFLYGILFILIGIVFPLVLAFGLKIFDLADIAFFGACNFCGLAGISLLLGAIVFHSALIWIAVGILFSVTIIVGIYVFILTITHWDAHNILLDFAYILTAILLTGSLVFITVSLYFFGSDMKHEEASRDWRTPNCKGKRVFRWFHVRGVWRLFRRRV